jgi:hypothetical protein
MESGRGKLTIMKIPPKTAIPSVRRQFLIGSFGATVLGVALAGCAPTPRPADISAGAQVARTDSVAAHAAALRFLAVFDSLQWEPFRAAVAPDVTVFLPSVESPRLEGAAAATYFERFFRDIRAARGQTGVAYLGIGERMRDLRVQSMGGAAVVTFHLAGGAAASRRTLVFRRDPVSGTWLLAHLHGSAGFPP